MNIIRKKKSYSKSFSTFNWNLSIHYCFNSLLARLQKYMEYTRAFHLLERLLFCEGGTN